MVEFDIFLFVKLLLFCLLFGNVIDLISQGLAFSKGSVSGSGTGHGDPGSRGPAMPDPETFPYEWLGVRQYIYMPCF